MKITGRHREGVTILDIRGKITIGVGDVALRQAVIEAVQAGQRKILLNFAAVSLIDSSGIGELVSSYTTVTKRGGSLALEKLPPKILDILQVTQLLAVFDVFDDEDEAVASFQ